MSNPLSPGALYRHKLYARLARFCLTLSYLLIMVVSFSSPLAAAIKKFSESSVIMITVYSVVFYAGYFVFLFGVTVYEEFWLPRRCAPDRPARFLEWLAGIKSREIRRFGVFFLALQIMYLFIETYIATWWINVTVVAVLVDLGWFYRARLARMFPHADEPCADTLLAQRLIRKAEFAGFDIQEVRWGKLPDEHALPRVLLFRQSGKTLLVLSKQLQSGYAAEEIEMLLTFEIARYYLGHTWKRLIIRIVRIAAVVGAAKFLLEQTSRAHGFATLFDIAGFPLLAAYFLIAGMSAFVIGNFFERVFQRRADRYALIFTQNAEAFLSLMMRLSASPATELRPPAWAARTVLGTDPLWLRIQRARDFAQNLTYGNRQ
ncbi:MAG: M48 family metalloprotease [Candidatus Omnitrophica bacterium]|nr:M48 family metalloprotease [Candidatus Omnitrophota bacterium]